MDVRCGLCGTEYDFDDALISERGTTVQCTECGFQFKVYPEQPLSGVERWIVRSGTGAGWEREYTSLKDLQQAIQQGDVGPADLLSRGASEPRPLASIAELEPLFRQRVVRSGGTLLGMMPGAGTAAGGEPGLEPSPPAEAALGRRRVATKLGLPTAPVPVHEAPPPAAPPPSLDEAPAPPPSLDEAPAPPPEGLPHEAPPHEAPLQQARSPETRPPESPPHRAPPTLARTLPSATTPSPVADLGEAPQRHPSAPRQRIVSLLSAGEEERAEPTPQVKPAWATQTLPSTPHGAASPPRRPTADPIERPARTAPDRAAGDTSAAPPNAVAESAAAPGAVAPSAVVTEAAPSNAVAANAAAPRAAAPRAAAPRAAVERRPVAAQDLEEPEIVIPARRGGGRWVAGALVVAAGAAALWGWSRAGESDVAGGAEPSVAAAETAPAEKAAGQTAPGGEGEPPGPRATGGEGSGGEPAGGKDGAATAKGAKAAGPKPEGTIAPKAKETIDYRTRLTGASSALRSGNLGRAQSLYEAVLRDQPGNVEALSGLAEVAQRRGQAQKSAELYDRVLANNPSYAPALIGRGDQLWAAGDRPGAVQLYGRVVDQLGTTGTYGQRAQSRIDEARARPAAPEPVERAAQPSRAGADSAEDDAPETVEVSENPTSSPVDDTESDE